MVIEPRLSFAQRFWKRSFDITMAAIGLLLSWWLILLAWIIASVDTRMNGFFTQTRVGRHGHLFKVIKIRSMRPVMGNNSTVTTLNDNRITVSGRFFRRSKIDELPQLINVLLGEMSFVGPRPDVPGYMDRLSGVDRAILDLRPGITGPATLVYRNEEELLAQQDDPEKYNDEVIFPDKVKINLNYIYNYSFGNDLYYIFQTIFQSDKA